MKYSIIYSSKTGNTTLLAKNIKETLHKNDCIYYGEVDEKALDADLVFVGFWTDKGTCDENVSNFLKQMNNKKVFLFGTAGFGKSQSYFEQIISRVKNNINESNTVVGSYMCQGKMPMSIRSRYESMLDKNPEKMKELIENFDEALSHPNKEDFRKLNDIVLKVM